MRVKTGEELNNDFFENIAKKQDVDKDVVDILIDLFKSNKLTEKNILNRLDEIIKNEQS